MYKLQKLLREKKSETLLEFFISSEITKLLFYLTKVIRYYLKQNERFKLKKYDPTRTRTWNLLIRSQTPYPLGHELRSTRRQHKLLLFKSRCSLLAMVLKRYWLRISVLNSTIRRIRSLIACEQVLLFGRVKRVSRERACERRSLPK